MHPEHEQQSIFIGNCLSASSFYPELAWVAAVPNFRMQSLKTAAYMRKEGLRPGFPDSMLPVGKGGYNGFYIEFKSNKGVVAAAQSVWLEVLACMGNYACVCYDGQFAFNLAVDYIKGNLVKDTILGYWLFGNPEKFVPVTRNLVQLYDDYQLALSQSRAKKKKGYSHGNAR